MNKPVTGNEKGTNSKGKFVKGNTIGFQKGKSGFCGKGYERYAVKIKLAMFKCFKDKDFKKWIEENPTEYYKLIGKILPKEIEAKIIQEEVINIY